jgi:hypothetical protein
LPPPHGQVHQDFTDDRTKLDATVQQILPRSLALNSVSPLKTQYIMREEESHFTSLAELADGTGGIFVHDRNNIDQGMQQAAGEPEVSYVLGFTPQSLKLDGKYHTLKVSLTNSQKWTLQAFMGT